MKKNSHSRAGYFFVVPTVILFCVFLIFPMLNSFRLSLYSWNIMEPMKWVGLDNFKTLFQDKEFLASWGRTLQFTLTSVVLLLIVSFIFVLMLDSRSLKSRNLFQAVYFIPVVLVTPAVGVVWKLMFQTTGILNAGIFAPIFGATVPWLESQNIALYSIMLVQLWISSGYYMVMFIAGLQGIPEEYYESAVIDGASWFRRLFSITIPLLKPVFLLVFVTSVLFVFGQFALPYTISQGGPNYATELMTLFIYRNAFKYLKVGYASTASIFYFLTMIVFSIIQIRLFSDKKKR